MCSTLQRRFNITHPLNWDCSLKNTSSCRPSLLIVAFFIPSWRWHSQWWRHPGTLPSDIIFSILSAMWSVLVGVRDHYIYATDNTCLLQHPPMACARYLGDAKAGRADRRAGNDWDVPFTCLGSWLFHYSQTAEASPLDQNNACTHTTLGTASSSSSSSNSIMALGHARGLQTARKTGG